MGDPVLELPQQVSVELVELGQVVQDLTQNPLLNHRLSVLTRRLGNGVTEVLHSHKHKREGVSHGCVSM